MQKEEILNYIEKEYGIKPVAFWDKYPDTLVLRHHLKPGKKASKWFGIVMDVRFSSLGLAPEDEAAESVKSGAETGFASVLNVKLDPELISVLKMSRGFLPAYHMNKKYWITILLNGSVPTDNICRLIDDSYALTAEGSKTGKSGAKQHTINRGPKNWLVPANPKYFDLFAAFAASEYLNWKQPKGARVGDMVYIYMGAPYSAILFRCKITETDIRAFYQDENLTIREQMTLKLEHRFADTDMPRMRMWKEFDVYGVRGPRSLPAALKWELDAIEGQK